MHQLLDSVIKKYSAEEILQICKVLNKDYNIYDSEDVRWAKLKYVLYKTSDDEIRLLREQYLSNRVVNDLIFQYYHCERVIKYYFIKHLKQKPNHIVAFEMSTGGSRVDICRINGSSYAYEIKTEYDTFDRLSTQMEDYLRTFEKVYVIVPSMRVEAIKPLVPNSCGIIAYRITDSHEAFFSYFRKAEKNQCDITLCLESLSSNDLSHLLRLLDEKNYRTRTEKMSRLLQISNDKIIWKQYRQLLKNKYRQQWGFIANNFDDILPIDIQSFFSSNMSPELLYTK